MIIWKVSNAVFTKFLRSHIQAPRNRAAWEMSHACLLRMLGGVAPVCVSPGCHRTQNEGSGSGSPLVKTHQSTRTFAGRDPQLSLWRWRARPSGVHTRAGPWAGSECCSSQLYSDSRVWRLWFHQDSHLYGKIGDKRVFNEVQSS